MLSPNQPTRSAASGLVFAVLTLVGMGGCANTPTLENATLEVDESPELTTFDGLHPVNTDIVDRAWVLTPLDLSRYQKILPQKAASHYRYLPKDDPEAASQVTITAQQRAKFENRLSTFIRAELANSEHFVLTENSGSDVATLWGALVDVNVNKADDGARHGTFTLVLELRDSQTTGVLIRAVNAYSLRLHEDDDAANWLEIDRVASEIAQQLREQLDTLLLALTG